MNDSLKTTTVPASNLSAEVCSRPGFSHNVALISTNAIVSILGTLGNLLVCVAVVTNPRLRRPSNLLLFSLAIADLLVTMVCQPLFVAILGKRVTSNDCATNLTLPFVILSLISFSASAVHMAAISVDRFIAVVYPLHYRSIMENHGLKAMLTSSWILPIVFFILMSVSFVANVSKPRFFGIALFSLSYATVFLSYSLVVISLFKHRKKQNQLGVRASSDVSKFRFEIRVAFTLAIVIFVFTACWFPFIATFLVSGKLLEKYGEFTLTLAMSNSAMNFLIYGSRLPNFREAFAAIGRKIFKGVLSLKCSRTRVYNLTRGKKYITTAKAAESFVLSINNKRL